MVIVALSLSLSLSLTHEGFVCCDACNFGVCMCVCVCVRVRSLSMCVCVSVCDCHSCSSPIQRARYVRAAFVDTDPLCPSPGTPFRSTIRSCTCTHTYIYLKSC